MHQGHKKTGCLLQASGFLFRFLFWLEHRADFLIGIEGDSAALEVDMQRFFNFTLQFDAFVFPAVKQSFDPFKGFQLRFERNRRDFERNARGKNLLVGIFAGEEKLAIEKHSPQYWFACDLNGFDFDFVVAGGDTDAFFHHLHLW